MATDIHHHAFDTAGDTGHLHPAPKSPRMGTMGTETMSSFGQGGSTFDETQQPLSARTPRHREASLERPDNRDERLKRGFVHWRVEHGVPDVGGLGWRSKNGNLLKNQAYYSMLPNENAWNNPTHAGPNTWQDWHGPRLRSDAPLMEKLDKVDQSQVEWEAKKTFVNTSRVQTLDRFYNVKLEQEQRAKAATWAPHKHSKREVSDDHDRFQGELNSMPQKELKKVMTSMVLERDREAVRRITQRRQQEDTWKLAWKHMEQDRRQEIRSDLEQRRCYNDMLQQMSGQPSRPPNWDHTLPNSCTPRVEELAKERGPHPLKDVTLHSDFRGLLHADNVYALEALFPGSGHAGGTDFKAQATASAQPGWPPPPRPESPTYGKHVHKASPGRGSIICMDTDKIEILKHSIPVSRSRMSAVAQRCDDELLLQHATRQFLPSEAPPAPDQASTLLQEDWSPQTTLTDQKRLAVRAQGNFSRTNHSSTHTFDRCQVDLPPPKRSSVYPVLVPTADVTQEALSARRGSQRNSTLGKNAFRSTSTFAGSTARSRGKRSARQSVDAERPFQLEQDLLRDMPPSGYSDATQQGPAPPAEDGDSLPPGSLLPGGEGLASECSLGVVAGSSPGVPTDGFVDRIPSPVPSLALSRDRVPAEPVGMASARGFDEITPSVTSVCADLEIFEQRMQPVPRLGNFFKQPHGSTPRAPLEPVEAASTGSAAVTPTQELRSAYPRGSVAGLSDVSV